MLTTHWGWIANEKNFEQKALQFTFKQNANLSLSAAPAENIQEPVPNPNPGAWGHWHLFNMQWDNLFLQPTPTSAPDHHLRIAPNHYDQYQFLNGLTLSTSSLNYHFNTAVKITPSCKSPLWRHFLPCGSATWNSNEQHYCAPSIVKTQSQIHIDTLYTLEFNIFNIHFLGLILSTPQSSFVKALFTFYSRSNQDSSLVSCKFLSDYTLDFSGRRILAYVVLISQPHQMLKKINIVKDDENDKVSYSFRAN